MFVADSLLQGSPDQGQDIRRVLSLSSSIVARARPCLLQRFDGLLHGDSGDLWATLRPCTNVAAEEHRVRAQCRSGLGI